jgi:predicted MPP superfamily phosphohydrolase
MGLFWITFLLTYSVMHLYAFLKAKAAFAFHIATGIFLILFMVAMIFAPAIVRISEHHGLEYTARIISYIGYAWMGILLLFIPVSFIIDLYRFALYLLKRRLRRDLVSFVPSAKLSFLIPLAFSALIASYGYFEAKNIHTDKIIIRTSKIPEEVGKLRIVQISDVHLGLIVREEKLKRILKEVKTANPDILVSTGDLVDGQIDSLTGLTELFKEIHPRYGKFAITGNHEFIAGFNQSLDFTEKAGFTVLRGEGLTVSGLINIAGVDDPAGKLYGLFRDVREKELLSGLPGDKFTLLLKHRPLVDENALGLFDLQLSGHTHKGQIFPYSLLTKIYYPAHAGYLNLFNNSSLYVSSGAGTWGPPIRFLSPPKITVIELIHEDVK